MEYNPYQAPKIGGTEATTTEETYRKIGGWLVLLAISLSLSVVGCLVQILMAGAQMADPEQWGELTNPEGAAYDPLWKPAYLFEIAGNSIFAGLALAALVFMFRRSRKFPRVLLVFLWGLLAFVLADTVLGMQIPAVREAWGPSDTGGVVRTVVYCIIWSLYTLRSVRVKKTFVE